MMAWNVVDKYKFDPSGATDNAGFLHHLAFDLAEYYSGNKPLPRVVFPEGIFAFSGWPNMAYPGLQIVGEGMAVLKHIGIGDAVTFDGLAITKNPGWNGTNHMDIGPFYIVPNAQSGNSLVLQSWHRSRVQARVMGTGIPPVGGSFYAAIDVRFSVEGEFCINVPAYLAIPSIQPASMNCIGLRLGRIAGSTYNSTTTGCDIKNPVCEGVTIGIMLDGANGNRIYGGVCEQDNIGIQCQNSSQFNQFWEMDLEGNKTWDIVTDSTCRINRFSLTESETAVKTNFHGYRNFIVDGSLLDAIPI